MAHTVPLGFQVPQVFNPGRNLGGHHLQHVNPMPEQLFLFEGVVAQQSYSLQTQRPQDSRRGCVVTSVNRQS